MWKKFCEQDTNEENKLRMKYERRFRYLLRWNITNEEGLFKKELFDKYYDMLMSMAGSVVYVVQLRIYHINILEIIYMR